jgi:hypothetical protein
MNRGSGLSDGRKAWQRAIDLHQDVHPHAVREKKDTCIPAFTRGRLRSGNYFDRVFKLQCSALYCTVLYCY